MIPLIETIAIGDELLTGRIADTNSAWVGAQLFNRGLSLARVSVVPDEFVAMKDALLAAAERARAVIVFGGLGPTSDDKTAELVAKVLNCALVQHEPSKIRLEKHYRSRNRDITSQALKQVLYPAAADPMLNTRGAAPGFACKIGKADFFFLPGVPAEMKTIFDEELWPRLEKSLNWNTSSERLLHYTWRCLRIWESELQILMDPIEKDLPKGAYLGYRTRFPENHLTLYVKAASATPKQVEEWRSRIGGLLAPFCYSDSDQDLEDRVAEGFARTKGSLVLVESCTGGSVADRLTKRAGASSYLWGSYVVYQRPAKAEMLGVAVATDADTVSAKTTKELALHAKRQSGCSVAAAVTGWLGPDGGTPSDPLGTVYVCVVGETTYEERITLTGNRPREELSHAAGLHLLEALANTLK